MFSMFSKAADSGNNPGAHRQLPAGQIENDGLVTSADPGLVALATYGWIIKQKMDALQKELKAITDQIEKSLGAGASLAVDGVCKVTVSARESFSIADPDRLRSVLGGRFDDLIDVREEYKLSDKLKDLASNPDEPLAELLRECITVKCSTTVAFRPGKAL